MTTYNIRHAEWLDVRYLSPRLRHADVQEVRASHGLSPGDALTYSFAASDVCKVLTADEIPICMFGTAPDASVSDAATVWLLGTDVIQDHSREFLRRTREEFQFLHERYRVLYNYVDERNTRSIEWLKWAGAKFINRHQFHGHARIPFLEFVHTEIN